jgi:V/A-type H+-transporting ATPase subunit I
MIVSVLLIALFMLDVSELREHGASLGMLPLNIISSMGDIISYVRLYAVSLASVKVAENFNAMAVSIDLPMVFKVPAMLAILLFGHGLNFAMGGLSILVHAVRLNTLEFSGAKGVTWSGRPFKPFKSTVPQAASAAERPS